MEKKNKEKHTIFVLKHPHSITDRVRQSRKKRTVGGVFRILKNGLWMLATTSITFDSMLREHQLDTLRSKRYLIFSGGGMHGISHVGFLSFVKYTLGMGGMGIGEGMFVSPDLAFHQQFRGFAGTSVGAFLAMLLACGETKISRLFYWITNPRFFIQIMQNLDIQRAWRSYGAVPNSVGTSYLESILNFYFPNVPSASNLTFKELFDLTGKHLCVVTVNVSTAQAEYHSYKTKPNLRVADSVYASMCVPFLCQPMKIDGSFYFDGGILDNFPIVQCGFPIEECIGSYLQTDIGVHEYLQQPASIKSWLQFVCEMIYMMCRPSSNVYFPKQTSSAFQENIVTIPQSKTIHFLKIWASSSELYRLYLRGIYYTKRHFQIDFLRSLFRGWTNGNINDRSRGSESGIRA